MSKEIKYKVLYYYRDWVEINPNRKWFWQPKTVTSKIKEVAVYRLKEGFGDKVCIYYKDGVFCVNGGGAFGFDKREDLDYSIFDRFECKESFCNSLRNKRVENYDDFIDWTKIKEYLCA